MCVCAQVLGADAAWDDVLAETARWASWSLPLAAGGEGDPRGDGRGVDGSIGVPDEVAMLRLNLEFGARHQALPQLFQVYSSSLQR
jgi:hypothetical protein